MVRFSQTTASEWFSFHCVYSLAVPPDKTSAVTFTLGRGGPLIILIGRLYLSVLDSTAVKVGASRDAPEISNPKTTNENDNSSPTLTIL